MLTRVGSSVAVAVVFSVAFFGVVVVGNTAADAHTERLQSSPAPTQRTGGVVDFVDLIFAEPISGMELTVEGPDGEFIDGQLLQTEGQLIRYEMPAVSEVGRYLVRYNMISADGDLTDAAYFFTYHPDAAQPLRLGDAAVPASGSSRLAPIVASVVLGLCLLGLAMMYLSGLEKRRAAKQG